MRKKDIKRSLAFLHFIIPMSLYRPPPRSSQPSPEPWAYVVVCGISTHVDYIFVSSSSSISDPGRERAYSRGGSERSFRESASCPVLPCHFICIHKIMSLSQSVCLPPIPTHHHHGRSLAMPRITDLNTAIPAKPHIVVIILHITRFLYLYRASHRGAINMEWMKR